MYPEARTTVWLRFGSTWFTTFGPASGAWLPWPWPSASHWVEVLLKASGLPSQVLYLSQSSGLQVLYLHNAEQLISGCQFWNCLSLDKPWRFDLSESGRRVLRMEGQWNSKLCTPSIMQACSVILICLLEFSSWLPCFLQSSCSIWLFKLSFQWIALDPKILWKT